MAQHLHTIFKVSKEADVLLNGRSKDCSDNDNYVTDRLWFLLPVSFLDIGLIYDISLCRNLNFFTDCLDKTVYGDKVSHFEFLFLLDGV